VPLWQQLQATAQVLQAIRDGQSTTRVLPKVAASLRPGVQALVFMVLRHLGRAEALRQQLARKAPPPAADALLCCALALACADDVPYEGFVLVDQTVEAAKRDLATRPQANFINACLRRYLRESTVLNQAADRDPVAQWNHPRWWIDLLKKDHPQQWQAILHANNRHAPMSLRVNARKSTVALYQKTLLAEHIDAAMTPTVAGEASLLLHRALPVQDIPGFSDGLVSVQDTAAQMAAPLLLKGWMEPAWGTTPRRILDACAAPGGKTAHLLELCNAEVIALDVDPERCERIHQTLGRLGLQAQVVVADAAKPDLWWDGQLFDAILLDAPCTASGIVRRHPDVRWLRRPSDVAQLAAIQAKLLRALWPLLQPGGRLLYCTCSVFRDEGQRQIETFLANNTNATLRPSPGHLVPFLPASSHAVPDNQQPDVDGFFYALLQKNAA
jgi:16S rRNA (cytosine967-C5)-methyltransferase